MHDVDGGVRRSVLEMLEKLAVEVLANHAVMAQLTLALLVQPSKVRENGRKIAAADEDECYAPATVNGSDDAIVSNAQSWARSQDQHLVSLVAWQGR